MWYVMQRDYSSLGLLTTWTRWWLFKWCPLNLFISLKTMDLLLDLKPPFNFFKNLVSRGLQHWTRAYVSRMLKTSNRTCVSLVDLDYSKAACSHSVIEWVMLASNGRHQICVSNYCLSQALHFIEILRLRIDSPMFENIDDRDSMFDGCALSMRCPSF